MSPIFTIRSSDSGFVRLIAYGPPLQGYHRAGADIQEGDSAPTVKAPMCAVTGLRHSHKTNPLYALT